MDSVKKDQGEIMKKNISQSFKEMTLIGLLLIDNYPSCLLQKSPRIPTATLPAYLSISLEMTLLQW